MDLTIDEIILSVDDLMEAMSYHDDRLVIALEMAQALRDELLRQSDDEGYED